MFSIFFVILNIMSGLLETGAVIFGMRKYGIVFALIAALLYQIGNLTPYPFKFSKRAKICLVSISIILMIFGIWNPCCVIVAIPFFALSLQSVREKYKLENLGKQLIKIDRWFPSSKTCSNCNHIKEDLSLNDRIYHCDCCGITINRDYNASINIRNQGIKLVIS